jgi:hypothetical protein
MRLLSLDFDGCLHSAEATPEERFAWVPLLAQLLEPWPDVRVAVHSTWRYDHTDSELAELLTPLQARFIGAAPRGPRETAVQGLVYALKGHLVDWRVLDDAPDEFHDLARERLIVCDPATGLSAPEVQAQLRKWLEGDAL